MKPVKAIEILELLLSGKDTELDEFYHPAIKLGIEALKRLQDNRRDPEFDHWVPLPGETEE